jgi:cysteine desulfurase/selenocysteine lyase
VNAARELCTLARERGVLTFVDGAQAVPHRRVDVQHIGCDFYAFSAHKLYGPTGTGVLYGRLELLESMPPYQGGGSMIERVSFDGTTFNGVPMRFEAGTPNIAGAAGLHAAIDWFCALDLAEVEAEEQRLLQQMLAGVNAIPGAHVLGSAADRVGIVSFVIDGIHAHDLGVLLDEQGVAIRTGHHCTMPLLERFGYSTVARASLAAYSTAAEVDAFLAATHKAIGVLV